MVKKRRHMSGERRPLRERGLRQRTNAANGRAAVRFASAGSVGERAFVSAICRGDVTTTMLGMLATHAALLTLF
jgi:hypothetical protein